MIGKRRTTIMHPAQLVIVVNGTHFAYKNYGIYIQTTGPKVKPKVIVKQNREAIIAYWDAVLLTMKHIEIVNNIVPITKHPI